MRTYRLTATARREIRDVWAHIHQTNSAEVADQQLDRFYQAFETLAHYPDAGRRRDELLPDVRSYAVTPFIIFYQHRDDRLVILHIIHGSRDLPTLFSEDA